MRILLLTRSENVHADAVAEMCQKSAKVVRLDFDFENGATEKSFPNVTINNSSSILGVYAPDAVFVHHPRISCSSEWFQDDIERKLFISSWDSVQEWMEHAYENAVWINRPSANKQCRNILRQLRIAERIGFKVPATLFTNQAEQVSSFAEDDDVIIKQGNLGTHLEGKRILTSLVDVSSLSDEQLLGCPCLFQKYIEKAFELRVHVVGENVFACKIDAQASVDGRIDWRVYDFEKTLHETYTLDSSVSKKCMNVVQKLGLRFGIIDIIVTPEGEFVFLECNAQGHWLWIEELTGLPITSTLCEELLSAV